MQTHTPLSQSFNTKTANASAQRAATRTWPNAGRQGDGSHSRRPGNRVMDELPWDMHDGPRDPGSGLEQPAVTRAAPGRTPRPRHRETSDPWIPVPDTRRCDGSVRAGEVAYVRAPAPGPLLCDGESRPRARCPCRTHAGRRSCRYRSSQPGSPAASPAPRVPGGVSGHPASPPHA